MQVDKKIKYKIEHGIPSRLSLRNPLIYYVRGWLFGTARVAKITLSLGGKEYVAENTEIFRPELYTTYSHLDKQVRSPFSGFSIPVQIDPVVNQTTLDVVIKVKFTNSESSQFSLGVVTIEPYKQLSDKSISGTSVVVICMATFNPNPSQFRKQIESIILQDYQNWVCIVCDDASSFESRTFMKSLVTVDRRFVFVENDQNLGFYHNFERCLGLVPANAEFIALADQDDYWYPDKLSESLRRFTENVELVYCDMRIVHVDGRVLSDTYWADRKNHYSKEDVDLLAIANTVTGAATVISKKLLDRILPFPPRIGNIYHDNWIAILAAANGGIAYVDKPLYDYYQGSDNIIGHCGYVSNSLWEILGITYLLQRWQKEQSISAKLSAVINQIIINFKELYSCYHGEYAGIRALVETSCLRSISRDSEAKLKNILSMKGLFKIHKKASRIPGATNNRELHFLVAALVDYSYRKTLPFIQTILSKMYRKNQATEMIHHQAIFDFMRAYSGRTLIVENRPASINIIMSKIDPPNFFGGYIAMFNLARKIFEVGNRVRILLSDQREIIAEDIKKISYHDSSLAEFLSKAEFLPFYDAENSVSISSEDVFVATSVWTAHLAHEAVKYTKFNKFIYLTQEYEPIFFENGSYRMLAEKSYSYDYVPIVSTDILQRFFIMNGILKPNNEGVFFNNPVMQFDLPKNLHRKIKQKRKMLFYARPQPHASRNLYPIGCLAINLAYELGAFNMEEWEVVGIGGGVSQQVLPGGLEINHIGKFGLQEYKELLPTFDLGLSLMASPHPSLLPIEMAAAGLVVVTNTFDLKDQNYFKNISSNIIAVDPDIEALANALCDAATKVDDIDERYKGSRVNWPHDWDVALPPSLIDFVIKSVRDSVKN